jgi:hypothetical protein
LTMFITPIIDPTHEMEKKWQNCERKKNWTIESQKLLRSTLDSFSRKYENIHDSNMKNVTNGFKFLEELWHNSKISIQLLPFGIFWFFYLENLRVWITISHKSHHRYPFNFHQNSFPCFLLHHNHGTFH